MFTLDSVTVLYEFIFIVINYILIKIRTAGSKVHSGSLNGLSRAIRDVHAHKNYQDNHSYNGSLTCRVGMA